MHRTPVTVRVGVKGQTPGGGPPPRFVDRTIDRAIYDNGWDGNIAVTANADGTLTVQTGF